MRILLAHNSYLQPGGEDLAFEADVDLLRRHGHTVDVYTMQNDTISTLSRGLLVSKTLWNRQVHTEIRDRVRLNRPDVAHFHNTFPLMSPASIAATRGVGVPTVQTLHNFRLLCPNAQLFRDNSPCHDCLTKLVHWPAVLHGCYRASRAASAIVALSNVEQRLMRGRGMRPDVFITLTEDARNRLSRAGISAEHLAVRPNFLPEDPGVGMGSGGYAIFAGRLAPEKGITTMLDAWSRIPTRVPLKVVGDGPLRPAVVAAASRDPRIEYCGWQARDGVLELIKNAAFLVFPSLLYEVMPLTIIESFAAGTPLVASAHGAMSHLIRDGDNGILFGPGDAGDLARQVCWMIEHATERQLMRSSARREYERHYTAAQSIVRLMEIYEHAISIVRDRRLKTNADARPTVRDSQG